jgi:hypothetical protein
MHAVDNIVFTAPDGSGVTVALTTFGSAPGAIERARVERRDSKGSFGARDYDLRAGDVSGEPCDEMQLTAACDKFARLVRAEMGVYFGLTDATR